ncbi:glucose-1-phosphate adenylyltransferase [candidate division KSB1 bacterium]|nr:MAG: glucose-1-phosphate adenylyltransferase [candidate division KSB1 bacterium]
MEQTVAIILGGGRGTRLYPLTKQRSKPAVPFGGMYRLIDIPVSNCLNSGIDRIFVITQFNSASLNRHIALTYMFDTFREGFVTILAAEQTPDNADWYQGTADAVRKNLRHIRPTGAEDILILSGDHIYRMDYRVMLAMHRQQRADVTIAALPIHEKDINRFGVLHTKPDGRVIDFQEKPTSTDKIRGWDFPTGLFGDRNAIGRGPFYLGSMGIYLIRHSALADILQADTGADFGAHVIPRAIERTRVFVFPFTGYWEDIGTIKTYYESNLALAGESPRFDVFDPQMKLYTRPRFLPGARLGNAHIRKSLVCAGVRAGDFNVDHSIVGTRTIIQSGVTIEDSYIAGADYFESPDTLEANRAENRVDIGIGGDTLIRRAIIDKNARIGYGVRVDPGSGCPNMDGEGYAVRDGIVIVEKDATIPDGSVIPERR